MVFSFVALAPRVKMTRRRRKGRLKRSGGGRRDLSRLRDIRYGGHGDHGERGGGDATGE